MGRENTRLANLALLLVTLAIVFALAEGVIRWLDPPFFSHGVVYHPELGWVGEPNRAHHPQRGDRLVRVEYDGLGFRGVEHPLEKRAGIRRIVVVGDSFTEAAQVELHETYWTALGRLLNRDHRVGESAYWEVIGRGVGGFGTAQELLALEHHGLAYLPDLVIVQVFPFNDIVNNSLAGAYLLNPHDTYRPYLDPDDDFETFTYLNPKTSWLRRKSAFLRYSFLLWNRSLGSWGSEKTFRNDEERAELMARQYGEAGTPANVVRSTMLLNSLAPPEHQNEITRQGWAATDRALQKIHRLTQQAGARLMVLVIPHVRLFEGGLANLRGQVPFPTDLRYPETRIVKLFSEQGASGEAVPVIRLVDLFESHRDIILPIPAGHLNAPTHQLIAEQMAPQVLSLFPEP